MPFSEIPIIKTGASRVDSDLERWRQVIQQLAGFKPGASRALTEDDLRPNSKLEDFIREVIKRTA